MRLLVLSDLHVELAPFVPPAEALAAVDLVVLAGDVHNGPQALDWARSSFGSLPIVQIAGNHEFWFAAHAGCLARLRAAARANDIEFLENDAVVIDGVRFLGCTLWTDYRVLESPARPLQLPAAQAMQANLGLIADFARIQVEGGQAGERALHRHDVLAGAPAHGGGRTLRPFAPEDSVRLHMASRAWLEARLAEPFDGPTVVVSHHLPSWRSVAADYEASVTNAAFVSDLDALVARADLWVHGHTHSSHAYTLAGCRVICNPRGYRRRRSPVDEPVFENPRFDPACVVTVADDRRS